MITAPMRHILFATGAIILLIAAIAAIALAGGSAIERTVIVFLVSLIAVAGMGVYSGNSGILSFGHVGFMGIGAYCAALLTLPVPLKTATLPNLPVWLASVQLDFVSATIVALILVGIVAAIVGLAIGRLEGSAATISTLGLLIIIHGVTIGWRDVTRGAQTFFGVPRETTLFAAVIACILALVVARIYRDSISGLRLRAGRDNAIAANAIGIDIQKERLISFVLSAMIMALAGSLLAHFLGAFSPKKFYFTDTFFLLSMLIVGGMSTVTGALTGAFVITFITEVLRRLEGGFSLFGLEIPTIFGTTQIGIGLIILFAMFKKADGLAGLKEWEERIFAREVKPPEAANQLPEKEAAPELVAQDLIMKFGGLVAVNNVSLEIKSGEIFGLIGPNGSGKTTVMNILSCVLTPTSGSVLLDGNDLVGRQSNEMADLGIARTFQNIRLFPELTVYQNVYVAALSTKGGRDAKTRTYNALERLGMLGRANEDSGTLSYGDQRRVEIARALACQPSLLFLDEPAAGMNREETDQLMETLRQLCADLGIGILLVDHDLKLINQLCDRVAVLNEGKKIAEGTPEEVRNNPAVIDAYLGRSA
ncbi:branched-chain amino acid ABC transporter ATP-binding protein/permease [Maritalea porphyrae]|jgi:branched-chain amino acid transport system permease protein|uniref:branched-chain amino acid ABC transporter ATP-binding protein/permease n=1 Tax=Maritalea porphyrae TaxID=880732 RepID=UPI0022AEF6E6|nr:branched-chain amino acid ABC transporter ATP-binding protein/permease [Maritalea porphyrae]MCZ4271680.1 branched-chain amino acid ABC transporter ATP-binding protein/permease [Maritalea porphyrae]